MTASDHDARTFEPLDPVECRYLVRWETVGRIAFDDGHGAPAVYPVNFVMEGDVIVFRTQRALAERIRDRAVSFQVDRTDDYRRVGWSVLVRGRAEMVDGPAMAELPVQPWAPGDREIPVRIVPTDITGRRIELMRAPVDERGYL